MNIQEKFIATAKQLIVDYLQDRDITVNDIYVVWSVKVLQNSKALLSAPGKGIPYFEVTYNGDKKEIYLDVYKKEVNKCVLVEF